MSDPSNSVAQTNSPAAVSSPKSNWLKYVLGGCGCVTLLLLALVAAFVAMVGVGVGDTISKVADRFFPRAHRKDFGETAAAKLAELVRKHGLRKSEFSEWTNMNVLDAWLASGVGKSTYEVQLINPTARSGTRLVLALTRDHDFNKPRGQRAGSFHVTKIEIEKGGRAQK